MFPIRDDNTGRILQGLGTNESFTYAFSTIPQEIRTGNDGVTLFSVGRPVEARR